MKDHQRNQECPACGFIGGLGVTWFKGEFIRLDGTRSDRFAIIHCRCGWTTDSISEFW